jgi:hypothetical protein
MISARRIFVVLLIPAAVAVVYTGCFRQRIKAKITTERVRVLSQILMAEKPRQTSNDVLAQLSSKYGRADVLTDAWGNSLAVRREGSHYVVISFGRDGVESGCCAATELLTPDSDLIAVDGEWRQVRN